MLLQMKIPLKPFLGSFEHSKVYRKSQEIWALQHFNFKEKKVSEKSAGTMHVPPRTIRVKQGYDRGAKLIILLLICEVIRRKQSLTIKCRNKLYKNKLCHNHQYHLAEASDVCFI